MPDVYRFLLSPRWIGLGLLMTLPRRPWSASACGSWTGTTTAATINARIDAATQRARRPLADVLAAPVAGRVGAAPTADADLDPGDRDRALRPGARDPRPGPDLRRHGRLRGDHPAGARRRHRGPGRPRLDPAVRAVAPPPPPTVPAGPDRARSPWSDGSTRRRAGPARRSRSAARSRCAGSRPEQLAAVDAVPALRRVPHAGAPDPAGRPDVRADPARPRERRA